VAGRGLSKRSTAAQKSTPDTASAGMTNDERATELSEVVGHHVRTFRKELGLSLRGLSERSGLSIGFLSQLERGLTSIGLTTLRDLASTLGRDITEFFDEAALESAAAERGSADADVISTAVRPRSPGVKTDSADRYFTLTRATGEHTSQYISGERTYRMLSKRAGGLVLEPMIVSIAPGSHSDVEVHAGEEFAYVLQGQLCYTVEDVEHRLLPGDSLHLKSSIPHSLYNDTDEVTVVVSVVTPRLF